MASKIGTRIRQYLSQAEYRPLTAEVLAKKLEITKNERTRFERALTRLVNAGEVVVGNRNRLRLKSTKSHEILGVLKKIASGAGFVIPNDAPKEGTQADRKAHDIYIAAEDLLDACSGDEVAVVLTKKRRRGGQRCGRVQKIVTRATNTFVGTYREDNGAGWVQVDGNVFQDWIYVGDGGAKGAQPEDTVVMEMIRFPSHQTEGEAVITKVLGERGAPGVDLQLIIHEFGLPQEFPEKVLEAASLEAEAFSEDNFEGRVDFTRETILTIDPKDARDFDDAISLRRNEAGNWLLGVHIADVSHFVKPGSTLDREAKQRGNSIYLPQRVIPMLPEVISNGLASLQANKNRYAKSVFIEITPEGIPVHTEFENTVIKVNKRFAYEEVMPILNNPQQGNTKIPAKVRALLRRMYELSKVLRARRMGNTALQLEMPELKLQFNKKGQVIGATAAEHDESHEIIEEFMLAANVAVAEFLTEKGKLFARRVHPAPTAQKMDDLKTFVEALGFSLPQAQNRQAIKNLLEQVSGTPLQSSVSFAVLRSMKQATYSSAEEGHYALNFEHYCHFTSPIRRYPDLLIHRQIDDFIRGKKRKGIKSVEDLEQSCKQCSETERRAEKAERSLVKLKLLQYVAEQKEMEFDAIITGVQHFGVFCQGSKIPVEGLLPLEGMGKREIFDYDEKTLTLTGRRGGEAFRLGDSIRVKVAKVDLERRELDLEMISHKPSIQRNTSSDRRKSKPRKFKQKSSGTSTKNKMSKKLGGKNKTGKKSGNVKSRGKASKPRRPSKQRSRRKK